MERLPVTQNISTIHSLCKQAIGSCSFSADLHKWIICVLCSNCKSFNADYEKKKKSYLNNKIDFSHRKGTLFPVWALIRFYISLTHEKVSIIRIDIFE